MATLFGGLVPVATLQTEQVSNIVPSVVLSSISLSNKLDL